MGDFLLSAVLVIEQLQPSSHSLGCCEFKEGAKVWMQVWKVGGTHWVGA